MANSMLGDPFSAGASVLGSITSMINQNKAIKAQQAENEKTRQFNLNLAKMQNAWNLEQWNRENAYNSPAAMMARYEAAGLNPALMYSQQNPSAPSPVMTSGAPAQSADMSALKTLPNLGGTINETLQNQLLAAQIDKVRSETEGQNQTNRILSTDADVKELTKGNEITINGLRVKGAQLDNDLKDNQLEQGKKQLDILGEEYENLKVARDEAFARIANIDEDTVNKRLNNQAFETRFNLECKEIAARIHKTEAEARQLLVMLPYMMQESSARTALLTEQRFESVANQLLKKKQTIKEMEETTTELLRQDHIRLENGALVLDNDYKDRRNDWQNTHEFLNACGEFVGIGAKGASMYRTLVPYEKPEISRDFYDTSTITNYDKKGNVMGSSTRTQHRYSK